MIELSSGPKKKWEIQQAGIYYQRDIRKRGCDKFPWNGGLNQNIHEIGAMTNR